MKKSVIGLTIALVVAAVAIAMTQRSFSTQSVDTPDGQTGRVTSAPSAGASVDKGDPAPVDVRIPAISVVAAHQDAIIEQVITSGLIEPVEQVNVQPEIDGQAIRSLAVDVGDRVSAGQTMAELAQTSLELQKSQLLAARAGARATIAQLEAQIVEAQSTADEAARSRDRTASLAGRGMVSQANLDQAAAALTAADARLSAARQSLKAARAQLEGANAQIDNIDYRLSRTAITAPVAGTVIARNARVGSIASAAGNPMFVLMRDSALEMRADVAERDLLRIAAGQPAQITVAGLGEPITGRVRLVEPTVDAVSRLGRVRIVLDDSNAVRAGMFAKASIEIGRSRALVLPVSAIGAGDDGTSVLRVDDDRVRRVPVVTGPRAGGMVAIVEGLSEGAIVVARAGAFVRDGDRIRPIQDQPLASGHAK